jgi:hypothetical protein
MKMWELLDKPEKWTQQAGWRNEEGHPTAEKEEAC